MESLSDLVTGALDAADAKLLKFHGAYGQDDRDVRIERHAQRLEPAHSFMVRVRMPGGVCTPAQWHGLTLLARAQALGALRITTRQTVQFHGVLKPRLKPLMAGLGALGLDSIAACGDVNRNVICHNHPATSAVHRQISDLASALSTAFLPRTGAYREIWWDEPPGEGAGAEDEPLYGPTYLPRKFKIGIAVPPTNDVDVLAQDLGSSPSSRAIAWRASTWPWAAAWGPRTAIGRPTHDSRTSSDSVNPGRSWRSPNSCCASSATPAIARIGGTRASNTRSMTAGLRGSGRNSPVASDMP
ncbi:hypothetical protein A9R16_014055 [Acidiferrobacter thiooxydans]|nr:hypothetical protein A9R16_014055 [Acidiferrobacter thiooxydans]